MPAKVIKKTAKKGVEPTQKPLHVFHLSVECFPIAKVGGLADVVGALPKYQKKLGVNASVVMPWFDKNFVHQHETQLVFEGSFYQGSNYFQYQILALDAAVLGFPLYFVRVPGKLDRPEIYSYSDESEQWLAFQHATLHWMTYAQISVDVLHCHDHHTGLVPFFVKNCPEFQPLNKVKTLFTIHNGQYQGWMHWSKSVLFPQFDHWKWGLMDWNGFINPMAAAVKCCDAFTTVSEGYLHELFQEANGLEPLFRAEASKSQGIINGIDTSYWNPVTDILIPTNYQAKNVAKGKQDNKLAFCAKFGINPEMPLVTYIGRFAKEKGADQLPEIVANIFNTQDQPLNFFILGSGDPDIQNVLGALEHRFKGKLCVYFGYNEQLAHEAYAASDMLLMPSWVEPCGLNQMYALKYGTIPIVRYVGGLKDTVLDVSLDGGYGFTYNDHHPSQALHGIYRALELYHQKAKWQAIRTKAMKIDFSWENSAIKYVNLYNLITS